jgi:hypothetical protein
MFKIMNRYDKVIFTSELASTLRDAVIEAFAKDVNLVGARLTGVDLSGTNLKGVDFRGANLRDADFRRSNLEGAKFESAYLGDANFKSANLRRSNFKDANLEGADFRGASLNNANFNGAYLEGAKIERANPLAKRGISEFAHYIVAVKKRMVNHFGIRATAAAAVVNNSKWQLQKWFVSGVPADTAARYLDTAGFAYAHNPIANPISHETWLWLAAAGSAALGVAFLAQSTSLVNAPTPVETTPPALPAGSSNQETLGPLGAQTPSTSI